jgi:hypothetical protein
MSKLMKLKLMAAMGGLAMSVTFSVYAGDHGHGREYGHSHRGEDHGWEDHRHDDWHGPRHNTYISRETQINIYGPRVIDRPYYAPHYHEHAEYVEPRYRERVIYEAPRYSEYTVYERPVPYLHLFDFLVDYSRYDD